MARSCAPSGSPMIRVLIADDQPVVRSGLRMIFDGEEDISIVGEACDGAEAVEAARHTQPDVVLMDIRMPGMDGIEATRRLTTEGEHLRVVILTAYDPDQHVFESLAAGASGFLLKSDSPERLIAAVRAVHAGESLFTPTVTRRLIERYVAAPPPGNATDPPSSLTARETDVLGLIAQGLSNSEIGGNYSGPRRVFRDGRGCR